MSGLMLISPFDKFREKVQIPRPTPPMAKLVQETHRNKKL